MIRLILFIIFFAVFLAFIVLNLEHKSDISLGFIEFTDIPVFLSALVSFTLGMMFTLPLVFLHGRRKKASGIPAPDSAGEEKKFLGFWRKKSPSGAAVSEQTFGQLEDIKDDVKKEKGPYGID